MKTLDGEKIVSVFVGAVCWTPETGWTNGNTVTTQDDSGTLRHYIKPQS